MSFLDRLGPPTVMCAKSGGHSKLKADQLKVIFNCEKGLAEIHIFANSPRYAQALLIQGTRSIVEVDAWKLLIMKYEATKHYGLIPAATYSIREILERIKALFNAIWIVRSGLRITTGHSVLLPNLARAILGIEKLLVTAEDWRQVAAILKKIINQIDCGHIYYGRNMP